MNWHAFIHWWLIEVPQQGARFWREELALIGGLCVLCLLMLTLNIWWDYRVNRRLRRMMRERAMQWREAQAVRRKVGP